MTEPTPHQPGDFDSLVAARSGADAGTPSGRGWVLPTVTVGLALFGIVAVATAVLVPAGDAPAAVAEATRSPTSAVSPAETPERMPSATPTGTVTGAAPLAAVTDTPIADLAAPSWIARIAAAGNIPERALRAYAGASIDVARTHPGCGLGWNTLAAIGLVETEHGSMHGATVRADGAVLPPIIGIPLDGNDTIPVPDTDGGRLDGDTTWDRAVGPMQFIPSTWAMAAQDGNRDGTKDINQIDDAVLAAAVHLCEVGGDLTLPENWIAAISAYNPSVEYNNRVAAAADHYATLR